MVKRPSFQFYPGDWLSDLSLKNCSLAAQGLWISMICLMHQGYPYGYLRTRGQIDENGEMKGGETLTSKRLACIVGVKLKSINTLLHELEVNGVFDRDVDGTIYSKRMVKDEKVRNSRASGGIKSIEHPNTCKPKSENVWVPLEDTHLVPPPSSSSSTSSVKIKKIISPKPSFSIEIPHWLASCDWENFVQHRKEMKAPLTERSAKMAIRTLQELRDSGNDIEQVIRQTIVNRWKGLFPIKQINQSKEVSYVEMLKQAGESLHSQYSSPFLEIPSNLGGEMDKKSH